MSENRTTARYRLMLFGTFFICTCVGVRWIALMHLDARRDYFRVSQEQSKQPDVLCKSEDIYVPPHVSDPNFAALVNRNAQNRISVESVSKLPIVKEPNDFAALITVLTDAMDDDTVRNEVANLLERSHCSHITDALFHVLDNPREKPRFRSFAMQHLGGLLKSNDDYRREDILVKVRQALNDRHVEVRREALLALVRQRDHLGMESAVKWLTLKPQPDGDVRDLAVRCNRELELRENIGVIRKLLRDDNNSVRIAAIVALSEWYDDESRPAFLEASESRIERLQNAGKAAISRLNSLERILPKDQQNTENLTHMLDDDRAHIRNQAAIALSHFGMDIKPAIPAVIRAFSKLDSASTTAQILVYLDLFRKVGFAAASSSESILILMNERASIYQNRTKHEVNQLRAYMLLTLADVGRASDGMLYIAESLANSDKDMVYNYAVAAHAAGTLASDGRGLEPLLLRALLEDFKDSPITLESYRFPLTPTTTTSGRIEAIRALRKIGSNSTEVIPLLEKLCQSDPTPEDKLPTWKLEARQTLALLKK